jgi:hypothetical protein
MTVFSVQGSFTSTMVLCDLPTTSADIMLPMEVLLNVSSYVRQSYSSKIVGMACCDLTIHTEV